MIRLGFLCAFSLFCVACASVQPQEQVHHCPLGNTTEISVTSHESSPLEFALATAARATLRDGYERFRIVKSASEGDDYMMLIRMIPNDDVAPVSDMLVARDILATSTAPPALPIL